MRCVLWAWRRRGLDGRGDHKYDLKGNLRARESPRYGCARAATRRNPESAAGCACESPLKEQPDSDPFC